jgi:hypothetical protein
MIQNQMCVFGPVIASPLVAKDSERFSLGAVLRGWDGVCQAGVAELEGIFRHHDMQTRDLAGPFGNRLKT